MREIVAYTDGGCRGNPGGIGGWAFVLIDPLTSVALERAGGVRDTTNNRMELMAAIEALAAIRSHRASVTVFSDSRYVVDACSKWMAGWKARSWRRAEGALANVELLQRLDALQQRHDVRWQWVAGHSGDLGNEHVDALANRVMDRLARDEDPRIERRFDWPAQAAASSPVAAAPGSTSVESPNSWTR